MELYRFNASDTHTAIMKVHEAMGPEALVYSTRSTTNGVEVLAGYPHGKNDFVVDTAAAKVAVKESFEEAHPTRKIDRQLEILGDHIIKLTNHVTTLQQAVNRSMKEKKSLYGAPMGFISYIKRIRANFKKEGVYENHNDEL